MESVIKDLNRPRSKQGEEADLNSSREKYSSLKRKRSRLYRTLGEHVFHALQDHDRIHADDPVVAAIVDEIQSLQREILRLEDRIKAVELRNSSGRDFLPPEPGTDTKFPFSR
jgi:hypothetical protein